MDSSPDDDPTLADATTAARRGAAAPADARLAAVPTEIGHYRILERLGEGGMGIVYAAEDRRLQRKVALKVIRTAAADPHAAARLTREARLAAKVSHPLICQVFELGEWEHHPFLAMELLPGEPALFVGTPRYAAPEQIAGKPLDPRADLFSAAVVIFEMLAGKPPFSGATVADVMHAVLHAPAPVLTGSPVISAADRVLGRALAKSPADRPESAAGFADELRALLPLADTDRAVEARQILRLAVLPFRLLRPDADVDYLALSLADALVMALSGLESLVVRSSLKSAKYAGATPDLDAIAGELAVDVVLTGSILRVDDRVRVSAQLVSVPAGDLLWTETAQANATDLFELHDELARRVVASLPLTPGDRTRRRASRPSNAKAYDVYLRGMQLRLETGSWRQARASFERCVELDPSFAPAWAELGRLTRVLAKYGDRALLTDAERALRTALELDPDNGPAQYYQAQLDIDLGRLDDSLTRLLAGVRERRAEPQLYAALVHACRYAGLLDASIAAHRQARRLDPVISTSVLHTHYMLGDFARALEEGHAATDPLEARVLGAMGRGAAAVEAARREEERFMSAPLVHSFVAALRAVLEGRPEDARAALQLLIDSGFGDGEGLFYAAGMYARMEMLDEASALLARSVEAGFLCLPAYERDPYLAPLRIGTRMEALLARVTERRRPVVAAFDRAQGGVLLGLVPR